jgi:S-adenosylmethionine:tRNA ribosyltransferase-isomerase
MNHDLTQTNISNLILDDFDYDLPPELIAQYPSQNRSASRLMVLQTLNNQLSFQHQGFQQFCQLLKPYDLLIFNNTKVLKARLYGQKNTGGKIEALLERLIDEHQGIFQIKASHAPKIGETLFFSNYQAIVLERQDGFFKLQWQSKIDEVLQDIGHLPLPPYIKHSPENFDEERYQSIFAKEKGAVAAPTASLHFDEAIFSQLDQLKLQNIDYDFLTLHIGAGTFSPVRENNIQKHQMHAERYHITQNVTEKIKNCKKNNGRVIAIGTTSLRALESAYQKPDDICLSQDTQIFIYPGYQFKIVDALLTNFHLPKSTLFMLLSAFIGLDQAKAAYAEAIHEKYRFFSYGDAMFCEKNS